jgi:hypothetical protein
MPCPYENNTSLKQLPCHWVEHPYNPELRICDICRQSYDVNDIDRTYPKWLEFLFWAAIGFIVFSFL